MEAGQGAGEASNVIDVPAAASCRPATEPPRSTLTRHRMLAAAQAAAYGARG